MKTNDRYEINIEFYPDYEYKNTMFWFLKYFSTYSTINVEEKKCLLLLIY